MTDRPVELAEVHMDSYIFKGQSFISLYILALHFFMLFYSQIFSHEGKNNDHGDIKLQLLILDKKLYHFFSIPLVKKILYRTVNNCYLRQMPPFTLLWAERWAPWLARLLSWVRSTSTEGKRNVMTVLVELSRVTRSSSANKGMLSIKQHTFITGPVSLHR